MFGYAEISDRSRLKAWLTFIGMAVLLSIGARLILETGWVHPFVLGLTWIAAFVWLSGLIIAGTAYADHLLKVTAGFIGAMMLLGAVVAAIS